MSQGRLPKPRIDVPEGFEVHPYGNQKNNIWEIQKEQMRKVISQDKEHFYSYGDSLAGAFPIVNENEIKVKAKLESEARWRTKSGFDCLNKRQNWNEHPKKPDQATIDSLKHPHVEQTAYTKSILKGTQYRPQDDGKPIFMNKVKHDGQTFSHQGYFKTVFQSGDGVMLEE